MNWKFINQKHKAKNTKQIVEILLENRGIENEKDKEEFFTPKHPEKIELKELEISEQPIKEAIERIKVAKKNNEGILIYGDYDADGVAATAILWEALHGSEFDVHPYIPDRFADGYGLNSSRVEKLLTEFPSIKLIITVDNGIVANKEIEKIRKSGVDIIVTDHHQISEKLPDATAVIHTDKIAGSAVSWVLARELYKAGVVQNLPSVDLAAIGTISDVMPLLGANRAFVKHGLEELNQMKRPGIVQLCVQANINADELGVYEIAFVIAPRINSMGRLSSALDSLRLVCTLNQNNAQKLATILSTTNAERQKIVDEVLVQAISQAKKLKSPAIIIYHESYHEGVIGLAASKLVEKFYRPAIVISTGDKIAKASARSIAGFNMIENIRKTEHLLLQCGGHSMAAGFSIAPEKIEEFIETFNANSLDVLTEDILQRSLDIDTEVKFDLLNEDLVDELKKFEPTGNGNKQPVFATTDVKIERFKTVGQEDKHLKLTLSQGDRRFDAIAFGLGYLASELHEGDLVNAAYCLEENVWNGKTSLQLKIKDIV